jgi:hypothetical protein
LLEKLSLEKNVDRIVVERIWFHFCIRFPTQTVLWLP